MERNGALGRGAKRTRSAPRRRRSRHSRARRSPATRESCRGGGSREPRAPSRRGKRTSRDKHLTRAKEEPRFSNSNSNASFPTANSQEKSSEDFDGNLRREKAESVQFGLSEIMGTARSERSRCARSRARRGPSLDLERLAAGFLLRIRFRLYQ